MVFEKNERELRGFSRFQLSVPSFSFMYGKGTRRVFVVANRIFRSCWFQQLTPHPSPTPNLGILATNSLLTWDCYWIAYAIEIRPALVHVIYLEGHKSGMLDEER